MSKEERPISRKEAHEIMVGVNKKIVSDYLRGSLYELRESTRIALNHGGDEFSSGNITKERHSLMEQQAHNLFDMIDTDIDKRR